MTRYVINNIRKIRGRNKISQEYIAAKLGISPTAYSNIENGNTKLTVDRLFEIADALEVDVAELLTGATNPLNRK